MQIFLTALVIALKITAIHITTWPGMVFSKPKEWLATLLDKTVGKADSKYIQKPLWDCLPCMSAVWTIILTMEVDVSMIMVVCGMCALIDCALPFSNHDPERL